MVSGQIYAIDGTALFVDIRFLDSMPYASAFPGGHGAGAPAAWVGRGPTGLAHWGNRRRTRGG